jgi:hypothetical protein
MLQSITQNLGFKLIFWNTLHKGNLNEHAEGTKLDLSGSVGWIFKFYHSLYVKCEYYMNPTSKNKIIKYTAFSGTMQMVQHILKI